MNLDLTISVILTAKLSSITTTSPLAIKLPVYDHIDRRASLAFQLDYRTLSELQDILYLALRGADLN